jgi:hypothetical protein
MGFQILNIQQVSQPITITGLTNQMISDLIQCYNINILPIDVQNYNGIYDRLGLAMNYPRITEDVVKEFYGQLDDFVWMVIAVIQGNYYTTGITSTSGTTSGITGITGITGATSGVTGTTITMFQAQQPQSIAEVQAGVYEVISRDFFNSESWIYGYTIGDFGVLRCFVNECVNMFFAVNDHGSFSDVVNAVIAAYPPLDYPIY